MNRTKRKVDAKKRHEQLQRIEKIKEFIENNVHGTNSCEIIDDKITPLLALYMERIDNANLARIENDADGELMSIEPCTIHKRLSPMSIRKKDEKGIKIIIR